MYSVGIGNVHQERHETITELFLQTIGVSLFAYRTEHAKSLRNKHLCGSPADSGGDPVTTTSWLFAISVLFLGSTVVEFIYFILIVRVYYRQCDGKSGPALIRTKVTTTFTPSHKLACAGSSSSVHQFLLPAIGNTRLRKDRTAVRVYQRTCFYFSSKLLLRTSPAFYQQCPY